MPEKKDSKHKEGTTKPSILIRFVRHAESRNNQVYRNARRLFKGGTPQFNLAGWTDYVDTHRSSDPHISDPAGTTQADCLGEYLSSRLRNEASVPARFIVSPMRRTLETLLPTLTRLTAAAKEDGTTTTAGKNVCEVIVNGFYFESEGCHNRGTPEPGLSPNEITAILSPPLLSPSSISYVGFSSPDHGWYSHGVTNETREESEVRAAKFYLWLLEYLDAQLCRGGGGGAEGEDIFDAGVSCCEETTTTERRTRRTVVLVGHGDFMSLVLKRIMAGFGYAVENEGVCHRTGFVHFNTGITELEYFGNGRFLLMHSNHTPHLTQSDLLTGGSLKDGWSYVMPHDQCILQTQLSITFADEMEDFVKEQTDALKSLYIRRSDESNTPKKRLSYHLDDFEDAVGTNGDKDDDLRNQSSRCMLFSDNDPPNDLQQRRNNATTSVEQLPLLPPTRRNSRKDDDDTQTSEITFVIKRGMQVVGCAWYEDDTGRIKDVVVRPSARKSQLGRLLVENIKDYVRTNKEGSTKCLVAEPPCEESRAFFEKMGFGQVLLASETAGER